MQVRRFTPTAALEPYVRGFTVVEAHVETTRVLVPDAAIVIGFRYGGEARLVDGATFQRVPDVAFTGMLTRARHMRTSAGGGIVLAAFNEGGASAFFAEPLHELFGCTLALDDLLPQSEIERTRSRVASARNDAERIAILEERLLARLAPGPADPIVSAAVRAIRAARGSLRIGALAGALDIGQDALEKRFRRRVGASPKQLASILRLHHAVTSYRPGASLSRLALDAGYFDQAHFNRELRAVTGESPQKFFLARAHC
jgi:AraC-like DNA-binding protein